jgi:hypothetical protein
LSRGRDYPENSLVALISIHFSVMNAMLHTPTSPTWIGHNSKFYNPESNEQWLTLTEDLSVYMQFLVVILSINKKWYEKKSY